MSCNRTIESTVVSNGNLAIRPSLLTSTRPFIFTIVACVGKQINNERVSSCTTLITCN
ncbi:unnamed protein product [Schistosoma mattheei]|uniref:Uncharacterized protein n=1 Tax=Schistosoma mattheei TaxID=31246 RepID=A0A3P7XF93_9TREM|nr:unnamed protein product [Schistosoma mattheei]